MDVKFSVIIGCEGDKWLSGRTVLEGISCDEDGETKDSEEETIYWKGNIVSLNTRFQEKNIDWGCVW